jgi:hypothetical protein
VQDAVLPRVVVEGGRGINNIDNWKIELLYVLLFEVY